MEIGTSLFFCSILCITISLITADISLSSTRGAPAFAEDQSTRGFPAFAEDKSTRWAPGLAKDVDVGVLEPVNPAQKRNEGVGMRAARRLRYRERAPDEGSIINELKKLNMRLFNGLTGEILNLNYKITALEKSEEKVLMRLQGLENTIQSLAVRQRRREERQREERQTDVRQIEEIQREPTVPPTTTTTEPAPAISPWVYYPPGTKENRAKRYYPDRHLRFVGFGYSSKHSRTYPLTGRGITLERCLDVCQIVRKNAGHLWNGVQYRHKQKYCFCLENDKSHTDVASGDLHFKFY